MSLSQPLIALTFDDGPNTVITPHIAWAPKETRARLIEAAAGNLRNFTEGKTGKEINQVN